MTPYEIITHLIACWIGACLGAGAMLFLWWRAGRCA